MNQNLDLKKVEYHLNHIRNHVNELMAVSRGVMALECNLKRILSSINILELEFLDAIFLLEDGKKFRLTK